MGLFDASISYKPFNYPWCYDAYLASEDMHWTKKEVPVVDDVKNWKEDLSIEDKTFITNIFRFFTQADIDVAGGYINKYLPRFKHTEIRMMLSSFANREAIHIDAYSHLIETLNMPESTYNEFMEYPEMVNKHNYLLEFDGDSLEDFAKQIAVFSAFTEGVQLFSSFIMLLNLVRRGVMKAMGQIIAWSIADESLHVEAMIKLFRQLIGENPHLWTDELKRDIYLAGKTIVKLEDDFVDLAFGSHNIEGLTKEEVKEYIRYIADRRFIQLGMKSVFDVRKNPLPWVEGLLGEAHTNFFENRPTEYSKDTFSGSWQDVWGAWDS